MLERSDGCNQIKTLIFERQSRTFPTPMYRTGAALMDDLRL